MYSHGTLSRSSVRALRLLGRTGNLHTCRAAATPRSAAERSQVVSYDGVEFVVDENPALQSTWAQRGIVAGGALASGVLLAQGILHSHSIPGTLLAMLAGYTFAGMYTDATSCVQLYCPCTNF